MTPRESQIFCHLALRERSVPQRPGEGRFCGRPTPGGVRRRPLPQVEEVTNSVFARSLFIVLMYLASSSLLADEASGETKLVKHQITGLFCPEREQDFQDLCEQKLSR